MAKTVILHIVGEDPIVAEMEQEPQPSDLFVRITNPRKRDGKDISSITPGAQAIIYPWHRITFLEMMVSEEERGQVLDFFRD